MKQLLNRMWDDESGQDVAEYALMLGVILVLVIASIKAIGTNADKAFVSTSNALN
ncbi:MAG: Flp family type IVb pilin [Terriglobales bacterium]|jgi:Flp pilus assembly pilin Flp